MALLGILSRYNLCNLIPVLIIELFDKLGILNHKRKQPILEQMRLIILPLSECPLALCWILLLVEELVKDFHRLLIRYDTLAIELVLSIPEANDVVDASLTTSARVALATDRVLLL
jgi:hypothetical protein